MATKKTRGQKKARSSGSKKDKPTIPKLIYGNASPLSVGGVSMFDAGAQITAGTAANFASDPETTTRAVNRLRDAGFEVLQVSQFSINIAGTQKVYERTFGTKLIAEERPVIKPGGMESMGTFIECPETEMPGFIDTTGSTLGELVEGVSIEEPRYPMAPSMFAPHKSYWYLDVPAGVSLGCNADRAHRGGITGKGVRVAMVDSGWYKHPFFVNRGFRAAPVVLGPGATNPLKDESGHGTGESANIFACAPDVNLLPVKINFANSLGAFNAAVGLNPDIITCSWGSSTGTSTTLSSANQALAAAVAAAVASGIIVIFSAGNGHVGFPGQHPDVISAGGVFMDLDESLRASDYASGFNSVIYPNRRVPDLSGLVGMKPGANYIMLPVEPGDQIDVGKSGGSFPAKDETASNDGWAAFSGTSAAAPQLAGVAALMKQACGKLTPAQVKKIMMKTARDVKSGKCNGTALNPSGISSVSGPDASTGNGLVNAHSAVLAAKVQCLGNIQPITVHPVVSPVVMPVHPIQPVHPIHPVLPIQPIRPIGPVVLPTPPLDEGAEPEAEESRAALSDEDVAALQDLIAEAGLDD